MEPKDALRRATGFEWDAGNREKVQDTHRVAPFECEQIFFNEPLVVAFDAKHSQSESRYYALGRTDGERFLFIVFTLRESRIRIISARDMSRKERAVYHDVRDND